MCLSLPAEVMEIEKKYRSAVVEYMGSRLTVGIELLETVTVGDIVLVHAGEAIQVLDEEEVKQALTWWKEMLNE